MVSVIITTYGGDLRLNRAIRSVLNQSYDDFQLIVVDDNNPNSKGRYLTEAQMKKYENDSRVQYVKHARNINASAARNTGIGLAKGEYICFLDDDDFFLKDHIKDSVDCCVKDADCVGVMCNVAIMTAGLLSDCFIVDEGYVELENVLKTHNIGTGSNLFIKAEVVREIFGFDEAFDRNQDIEFIIRVLRQGQVLGQNRVSIVKEISSIRYLDYNKLKASYSVFDNKFKEILDDCSKEFQKEYYAERVHSLLATAKVSGNEDYFKEAISRVEEVDLLSGKEKFEKRHMCFVLKFRRFINCLKNGKGIVFFNIIMKTRNILPHLKYRGLLGDDTWREIVEKAKNR